MWAEKIAFSHIIVVAWVWSCNEAEFLGISVDESGRKVLDEKERWKNILAQELKGLLKVIYF